MVAQTAQQLWWLETCFGRHTSFKHCFQNICKQAQPFCRVPDDLWNMSHQGGPGLSQSREARPAKRDLQQPQGHTLEMMEDDRS